NLSGNFLGMSRIVRVKRPVMDPLLVQFLLHFLPRSFCLPISRYRVYNKDVHAHMLISPNDISLMYKEDRMAPFSNHSYFDQIHPKMAQVMANVQKVIIGKESLIELMLVSILAKGHVLLEDVPGVGKTMLVRSLAKSLGCTFKRIQFTPDLLPSDVTGVSVYHQKDMS